MSRKFLHVVIEAIWVILFVVGCSAPAAIPVAEAPTATLVSPTATLYPTYTPYPTYTSLPPTATPEPTNTPSPTPMPILNLIINENECTLNGPMTIPDGEFMIKLVINEQQATESGYALVTLEDGKTIEDLKAWPTAAQPPWVVLLDGVHELMGGTHTYTYNPTEFTYNANYHGGPYYLACFRANPDTEIIAKIGAFGPIEVKK
jgi:hypothetical protein